MLGKVIMQAKEVMTRGVLCVSTELKIRDAYLLMKREGVRHLPVLEAGRLVGIISDRDLLARGWLRTDQTLAFDDSLCADAMTVAPVTCTPQATVARIAKLMLDNQIDSVPIVEEGNRLIGLVTSSDLLSLLLVPEHEGKVIPFDFLLKFETGTSLDSSAARPLQIQEQGRARSNRSAHRRIDDGILDRGEKKAGDGA